MSKLTVKNYTITPLKYDVSKFIKDLPELSGLLPTFHEADVKLEIYGVPISFANLLRQTFMGNIPTKVLMVDDIITNDPYIVRDEVYKRVSQIPIDQTIDENKKFHLSVINDTTEPRFVKVKEAAGLDKFTSGSARLFALEPAKKCDMKFSIKTGYKRDYGCYSICGGFEYRPIGLVEPYPSSFVSDPRDFALTFTAKGNVEPKKVMSIICDAIEKDLDAISEEGPHLTITKTAREEGDLTQFKLFQVEEGLINHLVTAIFELDPDIPLVNYEQVHPLERDCIINVIHSDANKLYFSAVKEVKKMIADLRKQT
nr:RNA polymerase II subunit 3 [Kaumoebavirus]